MEHLPSGASARSDRPMRYIKRYSVYHYNVKGAAERSRLIGYGGARNANIVVWSLISTSLIGFIFVASCQASSQRNDSSPASTSQKHTQDPYEQIKGCGTENWRPKRNLRAIIYRREGDRDPELVKMAPDGSKKVFLTCNVDDDYLPDWSMDRTTIVYARDVAGNFNVARISSEGEQARDLTSHIEVDYFPVWSANDKSIIFASTRDGDYEIYELNLKEEHRLTQLTSNATRKCGNSRCPIHDIDPNASVTGSIAFRSNRDGDYDIYVMRANGNGVKNLTRNRFSDEAPAWSPDGNRIVYSSDQGGDQELYLRNAAGRVKQLTRNNDLDYDASFSPNGRWITWSSDRDGDPEIYSIRLRDMRINKLTNNTLIDFSPSWS